MTFLTFLTESIMWSDFGTKLKPLFSRLDITFTPCCSVLCLMPMALLANCHFATQKWCQKHQQKPRKVAFCSVECNMHTCYNGHVKRFRTGGCHDVSKLIFASNKKSARAVRRGVRGSWFPVPGDERENTFFFAYPRVGYASKMVERKHQL